LGSWLRGEREKKSFIGPTARRAARVDLADMLRDL
jgi:hypothetical protein